MSSLDTGALTLGGLFVAGLATSLHCAGMCGLLTCGLGIAGYGSGMAGTGVYHAMRLVGYALAGAIMGGIGAWIGIGVSLDGSRWVPLLLALVLVAIALGFDRRVASIPWLNRLNLRVRTFSLGLHPLRRAALVGLATPLLPCAPLYAILALALASQSPVMGAKMLLAFGLGPILAIGCVQIGSVMVSQQLGAKKFLIAKRALAAAAAGSLIWHFSLLQTPLHAHHGSTATCRCETVEP